MKRDWALWLCLGLVVFLVPFFVHSPYYFSIFIFIAIYGMIVLGLTMLIGYAGQVSLGHAAFFGLGAYFSSILILHLHLNPWLAMAAGLAGTVIIAVLLGIPTLKLHGHYLAVATLGLGIVVQIIFKEEVGLTGGPTGLTGIPHLTAFGVTFSNDRSYYFLCWIFLMALLGLSINLVHSRVGRALRAISQNQIAAGSLGISVNWFKLMIFSLSAGYASLAGSLYAHYLSFVNPSPFGFMVSVKLMAMVVIGGSASLWGALLGTALLVSLPELLTRLQDYEMLVYGAILILVMMFAPKGLAGIVSIVFSRSRMRKEDAQAL
jgi:branched-chain amino acid transport system permease protein